jgi:hypothetical protein
MSYNKKKLSTWRMLRDSNKLYNFISIKIGQHGYNAESLGKELGIYPYKINRYLRKYTPNLSDHEIIKICNKFNIEVSLKIELTDV